MLSTVLYLKRAKITTVQKVAFLHSNPQKFDKGFGEWENLGRMAETNMAIKAETGVGASGKETQKGKKPLLGTKARLALATLIVYAGGAIINEQFNDMPFSPHSVIVSDAIWPWNLGKSAVEDLQRVFNKEAVVPSTFDNKAGKATFGENNITRITPQEAQAKSLLEPKVTVDNKGTVIVTTLLPGIFPLVITPTEINSELSGKSSAPLAEKFFPTPKDFTLPIPKNAYYLMFRGSPEMLPNQDPNLVYMIHIFYYDAKTNKSITLDYENNKGWVPADGQKTIELSTTYIAPNANGTVKDLPQGDGVNSVIKPVASDNQGIHVFAFAQDGPGWLGTPVPISLENSVDLNQKLVVISSQ